MGFGPPPLSMARLLASCLNEREVHNSTSPHGQVVLLLQLTVGTLAQKRKWGAQHSNAWAAAVVRGERASAARGGGGWHHTESYVVLA